MSEASKNIINRREALRRTALMLGGAISAPTILGFLSGCSASSSATAKNFSPEQIKFLGQVSEIMIPETDTPGALEVGVPQFMDDMIFTIWEEEDRNDFITKMTEFQNKAEQELGKPFTEASAQEQKDFIYKEHEAVFGGNVDWNGPRPFMWLMKENTIAGYFSSEVGMTQVLQYTQVPGYYSGCITFEEAGGKVWAR